MSSLIKETTDPIQIPQLYDQAQFLISLPDPISRRFVKVIPDSIRRHIDYASYEMVPVTGHTTLHDLMFSKSFGPEDTLVAVQAVVDFELGELFPHRQTARANSTIQPLVFNRVGDRLKVTEEMLSAQLARTADPVSREYMLFLQQLLKAETFQCNGKKLTNVLGCLAELAKEQAKLNSLEPSRLGTIHGDLHAGNIMVNPRSPKDFVLIDPRGFSSPMDIAYDIGKLLHSFHGMYDFILDGHFTFERTSIEELGIFYRVSSEPTYRMSALGGGGSLSSVKGVVPDFDLRAPSTFTKVLGKLPSMIESSPSVRDDRGWYQRSLLMEAAHFCSMLPFHLDKSIIRSIVLYAKGTELLNEFLQQVKAS